jgi:acylphosphatase
MPAAERTVHVVITGRVQGVGYRAWTADEAHRRDLTGWVRNRRDGSVEAVFAGDANAVDVMLAACRGGPPSARVERLDVTDSADPTGAGFRVLPTA